jgi:hypothetical protein
MKTLFTRFNLRFAAVPAIVLAMLAPVARAGAQTPAADTTQTVQDTGGVTKSAPVAEKPDPLKRRLSDHEERDRRKATVAELKGEYKKWLDEDVRWIITDEEQKAFKNLANDEERDQFIEQFWLRRNPNPDSPDNEFRDDSMRASRTRTSILRRASRAG